MCKYENVCTCVRVGVYELTRVHACVIFVIHVCLCVCGCVCVLKFKGYINGFGFGFEFVGCGIVCTYVRVCAVHVCENMRLG